MTETVEDRIIKAASALFLRYGAKNITMDDIAGNLRMSKKTIYKYFKDKENILYECIREMIAKQMRERKEIAKNADNTIEGFITVMKQAMEETENVNPVLLFEIERHYPKVMAYIDNMGKVDIYQEMVEKINQGIQEGLFRIDLNVDIVAKLFVAQSAEMTNVDTFPPSVYSRGELLKNIIINFLRGISTEEGRSLIETYLSTHKI